MEAPDPDYWMTLPRRQSAVWLAAEKLWGSEIPLGLTVADRDVRIQSWLASRGYSWVGSTTIRRALAKYPRQPPVRVPRRVA